VRPIVNEAEHSKWDDDKRRDSRHNDTTVDDFAKKNGAQEIVKK
jgi:hypothetical protein